MNSDDDFGPWIDHDGMGCPVPVGTVVMCALVDPFLHQEHVVVFTEGQPWRQGTLWSDGSPEEWVWSDPPVCYDNHHEVQIVAYRVQRPRAVRELVALIETLPVPKPEAVDA